MAGATARNKRIVLIQWCIYTISKRYSITRGLRANHILLFVKPKCPSNWVVWELATNKRCYTRVFNITNNSSLTSSAHGTRPIWLRTTHELYRKFISFTLQFKLKSVYGAHILLNSVLCSRQTFSWVAFPDICSTSKEAGIQRCSARSYPTFLENSLCVQFLVHSWWNIQTIIIPSGPPLTARNGCSLFQNLSINSALIAS